MPTRRSFGLFRPFLASLTLAATWSPNAAAVPSEPGDVTNALEEPSTCVMCHSYPNADEHGDQPQYAPFLGWQGSMMANAARDPVFWAGVAVADQDSPGDTIDCIRCHSPRAFLEGRGDATSIDDLMPRDLDGVTCSACHRMTNEGVIGNAQYAIDDIPDAGGTVPRRGPWAYEKGELGAPPHPTIQDAFTGSSELCGTCHEVTTHRERVDDEGVGMGTDFNEQRTYSEWLGSSFAEAGMGFSSCQDCHMPPVADMPGCNNNVNETSHPTGGRRHDLVGANRFMVELLQAEYGEAGTDEIPDPFFELSIERMDELLATAATMTVEGPAEVHLGEGLSDLAATVVNNSGHKLPTGYSEGRVMWIEVIAQYGDEMVWSSGQWVAGKGPTADEQLRTYEAIADDFESGETFHLLRNNHWVVDSRIPPLGLRPNIETDPVGDRYTLGADGTWPNFDVASYAFAGRDDVADQTPEDTSDDVLDVQVRLLYLINTPEYIQFLADENKTNSAGDDVALLFDAMGGAEPLVLATADLSVPIVGFGDPPEPATSGADTTAGDSTTDTPTTDAEESGTTADTEPAQDDDGGGGGCSCTTSDDGDRNGNAWWMLAPLGLLLARRRRAAARGGQR